MPSSYSLLVEEWKDCKKCELHLTRKRVVMGRGEIPSSVLFCGEAPGKSEDVLGIPFVGIAGKLFDQILKRAVPEGVTYAMTNLVACIPLDPDSRDKLTQPSDESIEACSPRLQEFISIADPKLVVCVGKLAADWLDTKWKHSIKLHRSIPQVEVIHPAAILRANLAMRGLLLQRAEVTIRNAIHEYVLG